MSQRVISSLLIFLLCLMSVKGLNAQERNAGSPSFVVKRFYELLHAKHYAEGFYLSVYRLALEGLSAEDLRELEPDFARLAASLPETIEIRGEQISADKATVFIKLPQEAQSQEVVLMKVAGQWVIGDPETQKELQRQGRNYFFNERMRVAEAEANEWLQEILGAELIYFKARQRYAPLDELINLGGVAKDLVNGVVTGYRFAVQLSANEQGFTVTAVPVTYGKTGKLSFYADQTNLIRAEDKGGQPATVASTPYLQPK
jgi:hypothetical protein